MNLERKKNFVIIKNTLIMFIIYSQIKPFNSTLTS